MKRAEVQINTPEGVVHSAPLPDDERRLVERLGITEQDFVELLERPKAGEGYHGIVFDFPEAGMVAKTPKPDNTKSFKSEYTAMRLLSMRGYSASPKVLGYLNRDQIILETKEKGERWKGELNETQLILLAEALAELHKQKMPKYGEPLKERKQGNLLEVFSDEYERLKALIEKKAEGNLGQKLQASLEIVLKLVHENLDSFQGKEFSLIHGDLTPNNILFDGYRTLKIIDWTDARVTDPAYDVSRFFAKFNLDVVQQRTFNEAYLNELNDPTFETRMKIYMCLAMLRVIVDRIKYIKGDPEKDLGIYFDRFEEQLRKAEK
jgi:thiamine kinase-like enzyme